MSNEKTTKAVLDLLEIADRLLGPGGCPWDIEQTTDTLREHLLEETYEVIDAIDQKDDENLKEELGDLFYNVLFLGKIAEKENRCQLVDSLRTIEKKLIVRHPHVFGDLKVETSEEVLENWTKIKNEEKKHRKSLFEGIPKHLPALARGFEVASKAKQTGETSFQSEHEVGEALWKLVKDATTSGFHPELVFREFLKQKEKAFETEGPSTENGQTALS